MNKITVGFVGLGLMGMPMNTIKLIPINNQKTGVNSSFLMLNRIAINTEILIPTNIQKKVVSAII